MTIGMEKVTLFLLIIILYLVTTPRKERIVYKDMPGYSYLATVFNQDNLVNGTYQSVFNKSAPWVGGFTLENGKSILENKILSPIVEICKDSFPTGDLFYDLIQLIKVYPYYTMSIFIFIFSYFIYTLYEPKGL